MTGEQLNPTRMELMGLKDRIALAKKGYQLLKQKRDVLILELMAILHPTLGIRDRLNEQVRRSYASLQAAQSYHHVLELENIAMSTSKAQEVEVTARNVMGVKVPAVNRARHGRRIRERGYGMAYSSAKIDETAANFEKTLELILELAEKEVSVKRLLKEVEKTKRRVNALDYIVIPWLQESQNEIAIKLDEMERYDLVTMKKVKNRLEQEAAALNHA
ncbi:MAG: V-type ATP synthase subunit D [Candidatus Altiarchaeota archaeon]